MPTGNFIAEQSTEFPTEEDLPLPEYVPDPHNDPNATSVLSPEQERPGSGSQFPYMTRQDAGAFNGGFEVVQSQETISSSRGFRDNESMSEKQPRISSTFRSISIPQLMTTDCYIGQILQLVLSWINTIRTSQVSGVAAPPSLNPMEHSQITLISIPMTQVAFGTVTFGSTAAETRR